MTMMTLGLFISLALLLSVVLALIVIVPWLRVPKANQVIDNRLMDVNVAVFESRLNELYEDKEAGVIDEEQYQHQKTELQRQLLDAQQKSTKMAMPSIKSRLIMMIWIPILIIMAYLMVDNRTPVFQLWQAQDKVGKIADDLLTGKIDAPPKWAEADSSALISAMQTNVYQHAYDPNRWMRLSELFMSLQATEPALEALSRAYRLSPDDESIATTYAQVNFFAKGGHLDNDTTKVLQKILQNNPKHEGAMMLMAMGETKNGHYAQAQAWTDRLKESISSKPGDHTAALKSLDELSDTIKKQQIEASQGIQVTVQVEPNFLPLIHKGDILFIAIRDVSGGAPYAVKKIPVQELKDGQLSIKLSNQDAMLPQHNLAAAKEQRIQLAVTARISASGDANVQSGDFSANPAILANNQNQATVYINQRVP